MNEQERELDMALAEAEQENRKLKAEIQLLTEALRAQRTWVGLTHDEVISASASATYMDDLDAWIFFETIEAKLKDKNYGA